MGTETHDVTIVLLNIHLSDILYDSHNFQNGEGTLSQQDQTPEEDNLAGGGTIDSVTTVDLTEGEIRERANDLLSMAQQLHDQYITNAKREASVTVKSAQTEADYMLREAEMKAERIVNEARADAERILDNLETRKQALLGDVAKLQTFESQYRSRLLALVSEAAETLEVDALIDNDNGVEDGGDTSAADSPVAKDLPDEEDVSETAPTEDALSKMDVPSIADYVPADSDSVEAKESDSVIEKDLLVE